MRRRIKLTPFEKRIEAEAEKYVDVPKEEFDRIARALEARRKDTVLNLRINSNDLGLLKDKAKKLGVKYQTFIAEVLHQVAHGLWSR